MHDFFEPFVLRALFAGSAAAAVAGILGCFIVWRRMAYFGDSLAHGALLGVAIALLADAPPKFGVLTAGAVFSFLLVWLRRRRIFSADVLLGILAHAFLAWGVVAVSVAGGQFDLHGYLFGDILFASDSDLWWAAAGGVFTAAALTARWSSLVLMAVHEDLAASEGVNPFRENLLLTLLAAFVVASSIRIVGVLPVSALLVIPAATARPFSRSPGHMAALSAAFGVFAVFAGIGFSLHSDAPAGASIAAAAALVFAALLPFSGNKFLR